MKDGSQITNHWECWTFFFHIQVKILGLFNTLFPRLPHVVNILPQCSSSKESASPIRAVHPHHQVGHGTSSSTAAQVGPIWDDLAKAVIKRSPLFAVPISSPPDSALFVAMVMLMDCLPRTTRAAQMPVAIKVQSEMGKDEDLNILLNPTQTIEPCKGFVEKHFYPYGRLTRD